MLDKKCASDHGNNEFGGETQATQNQKQEFLEEKRGGRSRYNWLFQRGGTADAEDRASVKVVFSCGGFFFCLLTACSRTSGTVAAEQNCDQSTYAHSTLRSSTSDFSI